MLDKVILKKANALDMPYKSNSFDVVFASFILDLQKLAFEIKRVLKPGGRAAIVSMCKEGEKLKKIARCFL
ncbi:MAG: methyltransferase domain-containing protein [Candidatus Thermoplasmatota archaeon]